jgi:hypothetical protein
MTLEQLRIFAAVAEKQHVTQAARELNLTQSATSAAIAALEGRYGVKLFNRVGRGALDPVSRPCRGSVRRPVAWMMVRVRIQPNRTNACPDEVGSGSPARTCANTKIYGASRSYWIAW